MGLAGKKIQMAQQGSAEFRVEEVVAHGEVLGIVPQRGHRVAVVVIERQIVGARQRIEVVHKPAVDGLLLVGPAVGGFLFERVGFARLGLAWATVLIVVTGWLGRVRVQCQYPSLDISDDGIAAADRFLADPELPPALRRLVLEGRAGIERSLRARRFDGGAAA